MIFQILGILTLHFEVSLPPACLTHPANLNDSPKNVLFCVLNMDCSFNRSLRVHDFTRM